jgi:hypothetical protein
VISDAILHRAVEIIVARQTAINRTGDERRADWIIVRHVRHA